MNGDALSDLLLALVALPLSWRLMRARPGVAVAMLLIGAAAVCGVLRYVDVPGMLGPHRFFSLIAATSGLPLLAASLAWPQDAFAARLAGAGRFAVLAGGIGVVLGAELALPHFVDACAALSAVLILSTAVQARSARAFAASVALLLGFALSGGRLAIAPFDTIQELHIFMALSLALMGWEELRGAGKGRTAALET